MRKTAPSEPHLAAPIFLKPALAAAPTSTPVEEVPHFSISRQFSELKLSASGFGEVKRTHLPPRGQGKDFG